VPLDEVAVSDALKQAESYRQRVGLVLDGFSQAGSSYVVITANFTEGLPATPHSTLAANRSPALRALGHGTIATGRTYIAVTSHMLDLAVRVHRSRGLVRLLLSKEFANTVTSPFKLLNFRGGWVALLEKFRLSRYKSAQFGADLCS
jgi:hypothetical protein